MLRPFVFVAALLAAIVPLHAGHKPPNIILRVYVQTNAGLPESEAQPLPIPPDNEVIQVRTLPELTERQLTAVETDARGAVHLHFDHSGQVNLDAFTAQDQGRIMVVMIDGAIIYTPTIDMQITNGELIIPHQLTPGILNLLKQQADENNAQNQRT